MAAIKFWCAVPGCESKYMKNGENNEKFFRFPDPHRLKVPYLQRLTTARLAQWNEALPSLRTTSKRVCSKHFVSGSPAATVDFKNADWVPNVNLPRPAKTNTAATSPNSPVDVPYHPEQPQFTIGCRGVASSTPVRGSYVLSSAFSGGILQSEAAAQHENATPVQSTAPIRMRVKGATAKNPAEANTAATLPNIPVNVPHHPERCWKQPATIGGRGVASSLRVKGAAARSPAETNTAATTTNSPVDVPYHPGRCFNQLHPTTGCRGVSGAGPKSSSAAQPKSSDRDDTCMESGRDLATENVTPVGGTVPIRNRSNGTDVQEPYQEPRFSKQIQATPTVRCRSTQTDDVNEQDLTEELKRAVMVQEDLKRTTEAQEFEIELLRKRVRRTKVDFQTLQERPGDCKFYTGFDDYRILEMLFKYVEPYMLTPLNLTKQQVFLMTLQKLRFNYFFKCLSISYEVCPATVSSYFYSTLYTIYHVMHNVVFWPERSVLRKHTPQCFKDAFGEDITVIIDCFEIRGERPSNPIAAAQQWSEYKKSNTLKYLIGISSTGTVIFVSKGYGGRASDKTISSSCGFLDMIQEGDTVLADRGFLIEDAVRARNAELNMPAFRKNGGQLSAIDVENTRKTATVRIHVERQIGQIREKCQIIKKSVPMTLMMRKHNNVMVMDMIVYVAAILVNMCKPIIH